LDPREGAKVAVAEAARNLACSGARPLAVTDNLNFGNPYKPENFWQLRESVEGMAEACVRFGTPVTGGNVSLYNESPAASIDPTPTVGMVGLIDDPAHITTQWFKSEGDAIFLLGPFGDEMGGSHYLKVLFGKKEGRPPRLDYDLEIGVHETLRDLIRQGAVRSAHDCSEGGLAVALAECCISGESATGAMIDLPETADEAGWLRLLFNESQARIVFSVPDDRATAAAQFLTVRDLPWARIGRTGGSDLTIRSGDRTLTVGAEGLLDAWSPAIERIMHE
jgi:phosphoribosylformylglycinamidine synthase